MRPLKLIFDFPLSTLCETLWFLEFESLNSISFIVGPIKQKKMRITREKIKGTCFWASRRMPTRRRHTAT